MVTVTGVVSRLTLWYVVTVPALVNHLKKGYMVTVTGVVSRLTLWYVVIVLQP